MFRFQHVEYFWFLLLIPVIILIYLYFLGWRRRNLKKLGESSFVKELIAGKINGRLTTKVALVSLASVCLIVALANLQAGGHAEKTERKGLDVIFGLDVSNSMLAQDISPNRLTKAKELIYRTLEQMHNDRTGLVVFAGNAYLQVPLTVDYGAMKMLLASVSPGMIPTQGTNFSEAIQMADKSFSQKEKKNKVLVLISDGEDHDETAIDAAKAAAENGVIIYTIGIGSPRGSTIIDPTTGQPKVDEQGNVVVTKLNEAELKSIAEATGGRYQLLQNAGQVSENLVNAIAQLGTKNLGAVVYTDYDSYFQYFLGGGLILFLIAFLLPDAKKIKTPSAKTQSKAVASGTTMFWIGLLSVMAISACPGQLWAQQQKEQSSEPPSLAEKKVINSGNDFYHQKQYDSASAQYMKALKMRPNSFESSFNLGDALYQSGDYDKARTALNNSLKSAQTKEGKADAYHNIGNTFLKQRQWQAAADAFKKSLLLQPKDRDTKYNLAYAQEMLKQQQQENKKNNKNDKDKKNDKNDKDKQQPKDSKDKQNQDQQQKQNQDKKKQDEQQKQQQNQQQKDGDKDKKEQQPQMRPSKLTKQQADNILNALNQEEQDLHKRKKEQTGTPVQPGKDW